MATGPTAGSSTRIADRLAAARRERFIGRKGEIGVLRAALDAAQPEFAVPHFHGPGGVGKTTLLRECARVATEAGRRAWYIDGRNLEPSPSGLQPAPTQEQAAELLDLPFNTYRYQLAKGTERVTEWLWRREVAGPAGTQK